MSIWGTSNSKSSIDKSHRLTGQTCGKENEISPKSLTVLLLRTRDAIIANRKQMKWCASWAGLYIRLKSFVLYKENGCRAALFVEKEKIVRNEGTSWLGRGFFPFFFSASRRTLKRKWLKEKKKAKKKKKKLWHILHAGLLTYLEKWKLCDLIFREKEIKAHTTLFYFMLFN